MAQMLSSSGAAHVPAVPRTVDRARQHRPEPPVRVQFEARRGWRPLLRYGVLETRRLGILACERGTGTEVLETVFRGAG
jgi:hypothetical protein